MDNSTKELIENIAVGAAVLISFGMFLYFSYKSENPK
jgi:hypothetical protein